MSLALTIKLGQFKDFRTQQQLPVWQMPVQSLVLAQDSPNLREVEIFTDLRNGFDGFVSSGQVWALLIGLVLGYVFRSFTSY